MARLSRSSSKVTMGKATFFISGVHSSAQVESYIKVICNEFKDVMIIVQGETTSPIARNVTKVLSQHLKPTKLIVLEGKKPSFSEAYTIFKRICLFRRQTLFLSGHAFSLSILTIAKIFRVQHRILFRHYAAYHHILGLRRGVVKDKVLSFLSTKIIAISQIVKTTLIREGVKVDKIRVLPYGADLKYFVLKWDRRVHEARLRSSTYKIGMISRISKTKGIENVISSITKIRRESGLEIELQIVGAISEDTELGKIVSSANYDWLEWVEHSDEVWELFADWDLFLHVPIAVDAEGFGLVYLEGWASGIPCIFTLSGILAETPIESDQIRSVGFDSPAEIEDAILEAIQNRTRYIPSTFEKELFSLFDMENKFSKLIQELKN